MCGEKERWPAIRTASLGSPPRVRGKVKNATGIDAFSGITPACAGKRFVWFGLTPDGQDHPRVCGEKMTPAFPFVIIWGSPPRVRGKASGSWKCFCAMGITPACAGKRTQYFPACSCIWDHPRVCGEKSFGDVVALDAIGSPPRVRGKVAICPACSASSGITPACAGKSPASCHWPTVQRDHPRVCGEKEREDDDPR